jgi:hypothetical protein
MSSIIARPDLPFPVAYRQHLAPRVIASRLRFGDVTQVRIIAH